MSSEHSTYRVVFWGEVTLGHTRSDVARRFAKWFKIKERKTLQKLFGGRLLTLKKGLSYSEAQLYSDVIRGLGAVCRIEPEQSILTAQYPLPQLQAEREHRPAHELRLVDEGEVAERDRNNPFAARDLQVPSHPPCKYYDPRATGPLPVRS